MSNRNDHPGVKIISSFEDLISVFQQCNHSISILHQYSSDDFKALNASIRRFHEQASSIVETISTIAETKYMQEASLFDQAKQSLSDISHLITKLQFHDIIRQKLEHIQNTNQHIIEELNMVITGDSKKPVNPQNEYTPIIPDIIRLHAAQLMDTNNTYVQAFAEIRSHLQSIKRINFALAEAYIVFCNGVCLEKYSKSLFEQVIFLSQRLAADIADSLAAIKYCESFDKLVQDTNRILIACSIQPSIIKTNHTTGHLSTMLKNLEFLYTMESERTVYNQVVSSGKLSDRQQNSLNNNNDNIELF